MAIAASDPALANEIRNRLVGDKEAKATVDVIAPADAAKTRAACEAGASRPAIDGLLWVDTPPGRAPVGDVHLAILGRLHHHRAAEDRA